MSDRGVQMEPIPLSPGVRQDMDRTTAPLGTLIAAVNARWRKGAIGKANGFTTAGTNTWSGDYGSAQDHVGFVGGRQVTVRDSRVMVRPAVGDSWKEVGRTARFLPVRTHWLAFDETATSLAWPSVACIGDVIAVAYTRYGQTGTDTVEMMLLEDDGTVRERATTSGKGGGVVAVGTSFAWVYSRDNGALYMTSTLATSGTINTSGVQVGAGATLLANNAVFDVAPYSSTHFLMAWRVSNTALSISRVQLSDASITAFVNPACDNNALLSVTVMGTENEPVWCAFDDVGANGCKMVKCSANVAAITDGPTSFASTNDGLPHKFGLCRVSSTVARVTWREAANTAGTNTHWFRSGSVVNATVTGDAFQYHTQASSFPFAATPHSTNNASGTYAVWLHTDGGYQANNPEAYGAWLDDRRYVLTTMSTVDPGSSGISAGSFVPNVEMAPDDRATERITSMTPRVAQRSHSDTRFAGMGQSERYLVPALVVLRSDTATDIQRTSEACALVLYEVEGPGSSTVSDARARRVLEIDGRIVATGGSVQELYAQTPSALRDYTDAGAARHALVGAENGFIRAPRLLKGTATNGTGLDTGEVYAFCAVQEMISPDGSRARSAPSNIVEVTPSGNNLQVTLYTTSLPVTEREIATLPNRSVIHIYATQGNVSVFQRVTPSDAVMTAFNTTVGDGLYTYVHSSSDASNEDNEALYTDTGALANQMAPPHRFAWTGGGRLMLGSLMDPTLGEMSKPTRAHEPVQFTRNNAFRFQLPEAMTGGAYMDGAHVIFSRSGVYVLPGDGPDETGAPGVGTPRRLPSVSGCLDYRSVIEVPEGVVFQSMRGIELLPRGFGPPRVISGPVQDSLRGRRVISATVTGHTGSSFADGYKGGERILYLCAASIGEDGVRLAYDLDAGVWWTDATTTNSFGEYLATWDGRLVIAPRSLNTLSYEDPTAWATSAMQLTIGDARLFGGVGRGHVHRFQAIGEIRTNNATIALTVYLDGVYSSGVSLGNVAVTGTVGDKFIAEWAMRGSEKKVQAIGALVTVTGAANATEDVVLHSLAAEVSGLAGRPRVRQNRRAT
jgi:hypothetical protein